MLGGGGVDQGPQLPVQGIRRGAAQRQAVAVIRPQGVEALVFEHHVDQRLPVGSALRRDVADQQVERVVAVVHRLDDRRLRLIDQGVDLGLRVEAQAHRQDVDEKADQAFHLGAVSSGDAHADHHVGLPGQAEQQGGEQAQADGGHRRPAGVGQGAQAVRDRARQIGAAGRAAIGLHLGNRAVRGQGDAVRRAVQAMPPEPGGGRPVPAPLPDREILVGDGQGRQRGCRAVAGGGVQGGQLARQDARRPAVADDVVQRQQHQDVVSRQADDAGAQQRRVGQVEARRDLAPGDRQGFPDGVGVGAKVVLRHRGRGVGGDALDDQAVRRLEAGAQGLVPFAQAAQRLAEGLGGDFAGAAEGKGDGVGGGAPVHLVQQVQPLLRVAGGIDLGLRGLGNRRLGTGGGDPAGEGGDGGGGEEFRHFQAHPGALGDAVDHPDGLQAVAAEVEEIGVSALHRLVQNLGQNLGDQAFRIVGGGLGVRAAVRSQRGDPVEEAQQLVPVGLAVGGQRNLRQGVPPAWHHGGGQPFTQPGAQIGQGRQARRILQAGDDPALVVVAAEQRRRQTDAGMAQQGLFDFVQFDADAAQLDLSVAATAEFQQAVVAPAAQVAGPVQALPRFLGVGDEGGGGQVGAVPVSRRQTVAPGVNFPPDPDRRAAPPGGREP